MTARLALFGQPVSHSVSPWLHQRFAERCAVDLTFALIETAPGRLGAQLARFAKDGGAGANVTLPLKAEALDCCETISARARQAGAVNTLKRTDAGWLGDNTDGAGFLRDLTQNLAFDPKGRRVLIAGAGGAAHGVLAPLLSTGPAALFIANRDPEHAIELARASSNPRVAGCSFPVLADMDRFDLVINATSAGHDDERPDLPDKIFAQSALAYDLSYGAAAAPFIEWAKATGAAHTCDGRGMLIEQGALSFECWFDTLPDTRGLRAEVPL